MRLLVDMNLPPRWVQYLRDSGFDADHWSSVGAGDASDHEIMAWAVTHDAAVLTADLDFSAILAASAGRKPSVIQLRDDLPTPERVGLALVDALTRLGPDIDEGAIVTLDAKRSRVRVLPLIM